MKEIFFELLRAVATAAATAVAVVQTAVSQVKPVGGATSPVEDGKAPAM